MLPQLHTYIYCTRECEKSVVSGGDRGSLAEVPNVDNIPSCREEGIGGRGEEEILNYRISTWMTATVRWTRGREGGREEGRREGRREGGGEKDNIKKAVNMRVEWKEVKRG